MNSKNNTRKIEISTKILMAGGLAWIIAGGLIASVIGMYQIAAGGALNGLGSLLVGAAVLGSAWFMRREMSRAPSLK